MLFLAPILLTRDDPAWATPRGRKLLTEFLARARALAGNNPLAVATDRADVAILARDTADQVLDISAAQAEEAPLPAGTSAALAALRPAPSQAVAVLDFRNPSLPEDAAPTVLAGFSRDPERVAGTARELRDHPCQYTTYMVMEDVGLIHRFAPDRPGASLPFPLNWDSIAPCCGDVPPDALAFSRYESAFRQAPAGADGGDALLERAGDAAACISLPSGPPPGAPSGAVGAAFILGHWAAPWLILDEDGRLCLHFDAPADATTAMHLTLLRLDATACPRGGVIRTALAPGGRSTPLPDVPPDSPGFVYYLYRLAEDGPYDALDYFEPDPPLWSIQNATGWRILPDGRTITGRQDFPQVIEFDGSLTVLPPASLPLVGTPQLWDGARPHLLSPAESVSIRTLLDLIRFDARATGDDA